MSDSITLPAPVIQEAREPVTKWEREHNAFRRLLPQLLAAHPGEYVAVHNGEVVDSGEDRLALALRVLARLGNVDIRVGLVSPDGEPVSRSGVRREPQPHRGTP